MNAMDIARRRERLIRTLRLKLLATETVSEANELEKALWAVLVAHDIEGE